jgi:hypothetical protein
MMHATWPHITRSTPQGWHDHDPYGDDELEGSPLLWDTKTVCVSASDLAGLGLISDAAVAHQGSYWPNEPPVLAPAGYYWYDYGPLARGMHFWKTLPIGKRPSPEEQKADLVKHYAKFAFGKVPDGLVEALAQHGLMLDPVPAVKYLLGLALGVSLIGAASILLRKRRATS